jgi:hypothetical protein
VLLLLKPVSDTSTSCSSVWHDGEVGTVELVDDVDDVEDVEDTEDVIVGFEETERAVEFAEYIEDVPFNE